MTPWLAVTIGDSPIPDHVGMPQSKIRGLWRAWPLWGETSARRTGRELWRRHAMHGAEWRGGPWMGGASHTGHCGAS